MSILDRPLESAEPHVTLWCWSLRYPGPSLTLALLVGEALRGATTRLHIDAGHGLLPATVHRDETRAHAHAYWLPGDSDNDGLIDHVWVWCANGLAKTVLASLTRVEFFKVGKQRFVVEPEWMGANFPDGPFGPTQVWQAVTPYVTPKWRLTKTGKPREAFTPDAQLTSEIVCRGLPVPKAIIWQPSIWLGEDRALASDFEIKRHKGGEAKLPPSDAVASFPTITFGSPVMGPLALGYGSHFGLGQLRPLA